MKYWELFKSVFRDFKFFHHDFDENMRSSVYMRMARPVLLMISSIAFFGFIKEDMKLHKAEKQYVKDYVKFEFWARNFKYHYMDLMRKSDFDSILENKMKGE